MEVVILPDAAAVARHGADAVMGTLARRERPVLGLATGSSPVGVYHELITRIGAGALSLRTCTAFTLDEYVGLEADHPERYRNVIIRDFVGQTDLPLSQLHSPDGLAENIESACAAYEDKIAQAGGIDVQILGIGSDGHIAFNEPGSSLTSRTRIKTLTTRTRVDNARFFSGDVDAVPTHCLTQGIGTIMSAQHLVLLATGESKADAVHACVEGPVSAMCPASILQMHPHATVIVDDAAAAKLTLAGYFRETFAAKPTWQGF